MAPRDVIQAAEKTQQKKRKRASDAQDDEPGTSHKAGKPEGDAFKQKTLMLSSRGVTYRMRHVMNDLSLLLPNIKKGALSPN